MNKQKPLLSIAIIFRDNIRCIERCLKALQPLRDAVPCELVMADTGSKDGSREVAKRYADILIDFPWVDDFSAARNAVIERCSGEWLFTVDTDEYLDENISELVGFLRTGDTRADIAFVIQRNYNTNEMDWGYSDFPAGRMARRSKGAHYQGAIHERWKFDKGRSPAVYNLSKTILHHDGYVGLTSEKRKRNMELLREKIQENPDDLLTHLQLLESGDKERDFLTLLYEAVAAVERKLPDWERMGPPILRYAVGYAYVRGLPEWERWIKMVEEWFPDSLFTQIDVNFYRFYYAWDEKRYSDCIRLGEEYLNALADYYAGKKDFGSTLPCSGLTQANHIAEQAVKAMVAIACCREKRLEQALTLLESVDCTFLGEDQTRNMAVCLRELYIENGVDVERQMLAFWKGINEPKPSETRRQARKQGFVQAAGPCFSPKYRKEEEEKENFQRYAYTIFLPLEDQCETGRAARALETDDPQLLEELLGKVEEWNEFPIHALAHALERGVDFPLPDKPLTLEEMDSLASRLAVDKESLLSMACRSVNGNFTERWQDLAWVRGLAMAAVQVFDWKAEESDIEQGVAVARAFARIERAFLPRCYTPESLENSFVLPSMHRLGWHCGQAFEALDMGDVVGYVQCLRTGLNACPTMKHMVKFLLHYTPELQAPAPTAELRALAEQIRTLLSAYAPNDPAVAAIKESDAYQKVAFLIEGAEVPVIGNIPS